MDKTNIKFLELNKYLMQAFSFEFIILIKNRIKTQTKIFPKFKPKYTN